MAMEATTTIFYHLSNAKNRVSIDTNRTLDGDIALCIREAGGCDICIFATDTQLRLIRNAINERLGLSSVVENDKDAARTPQELAAIQKPARGNHDGRE